MREPKSKAYITSFMRNIASFWANNPDHSFMEMIEQFSLNWKQKKCFFDATDGEMKKIVNTHNKTIEAKVSLSPTQKEVFDILTAFQKSYPLPNFGATISNLYYFHQTHMGKSINLNGIFDFGDEDLKQTIVRANQKREDREEEKRKEMERKGLKFSDELANEWINLRDEGVSYYDIAEQFGVEIDTIKRKIKATKKKIRKTKRLQK